MIKRQTSKHPVGKIQRKRKSRNRHREKVNFKPGVEDIILVSELGLGLAVAPSGVGVQRR